MKQKQKKTNTNKLKAVILLAVCLLLTITSCTSTKYVPIEEDSSYRTILIDMLPKLPSMPQFPALDWSYSNGYYYITESDVDKLIKYKDYDMSLYNLALKKYTSELNIVIDGLK